VKPLSITVHSMAGLKLIKRELDDRAQRVAQVEAQRLLQVRLLAAQRNLFRITVGVVTRMPERMLVDLKPPPPPPTPMQRLLDEAAALRETMSDEVDVSSLLDTDEQLSFRRPGVGVDVVQKLRRGIWSIQRQVDLHGLRSDAAREALGAFLREAHQQGIRCVRVIHGKGLGSPGKAPVLKDKVRRWLVQKSEVVAFVQAPPHFGGTGAVVVLLQPVRLASQ
jgi:DNA-nicking Smr family endonuclease